MDKLRREVYGQGISQVSSIDILVFWAALVAYNVLHKYSMGHVLIKDVQTYKFWVRISRTFRSEIRICLRM